MVIAPPVNGGRINRDRLAGHVNASEKTSAQPNTTLKVTLNGCENRVNRVLQQKTTHVVGMTNIASGE